VAAARGAQSAAIRDEGNCGHHVLATIPQSARRARALPPMPRRRRRPFWEVTCTSGPATHWVYLVTRRFGDVYQVVHSGPGGVYEYELPTGVHNGLATYTTPIDREARRIW
jgi:hypothetical protein